MTFSFSIANKPFSLIKEGKKTIEMRLANKNRNDIKIGDEIILHSENDELLVEVINIYHFPTFKELYDFFPKNKLGYADNEACSYKDMYQYYSKIDIEKYGVIGFDIKIK